MQARRPAASDGISGLGLALEDFRSRDYEYCKEMVY